METVKNLEELENAVVVSLSPSDGGSPDVATFEQAFGEHSELFGKMRAKATKRKAARQAKKITRIENRGKRKAARQTVRAQQQEARQTRKDVRKTRKVARKELEPVEPEYEEPQYEEPLYEEPEYEEPIDEEYYEDAPVAEEEEYYEEEYAPEGEEVEYFEGEEGSSAEGNPEIHSEIQGLTQKIVWNKEAARRQAERKNKIVDATKSMMEGGKGQSINRKDIRDNSSQIKNCDMAIQKHQARIKELQTQLKKFGDHPHVNEGYRQAKSKLQKTKEGVQAKATQAKVQETLIDPNLDANIGYQRIEVPASNTERKVELKSGFDGPEKIKTLTPTTKLLIGVAVVGIALVVAKKYKWL